MIVVATGGANHCRYRVVAHGARLRICENDPPVADRVAVNYRKADISPRHMATLGLAMKMSDGEFYLMGPAPREKRG